MATKEQLTWWQTPEQQVERAHQLWPGREVPDFPRSYYLNTETELPLLIMPETFGRLWEMVVAPEGTPKCRYDDIEADGGNLRLVPGRVEYAEPIWLAYDPEHGRMAFPYKLWEQPDLVPILAASEVLSAMVMFPGYGAACVRMEASMPMLAGYQLTGRLKRLHVPSLVIGPPFNKMEFYGADAANSFAYWSAPTVRPL